VWSIKYKNVIFNINFFSFVRMTLYKRSDYELIKFLQWRIKEESEERMGGWDWMD
jgi:ferritin